MKLKITEPGWEGFSGTLGVVAFEDGVSVSDVSHIEANIISGNIRVVNADCGSGVGALEANADMQNTACVSNTLQTMAEIQAGEKPVAPQVKQVEDTPQAKYTKESLEVIADKSGIAGLREIGDSLGVKGTSISGLIESILSKSNPEVTAPLAEGQPDVVTSEQAK